MQHGARSASAWSSWAFVHPRTSRSVQHNELTVQSHGREESRARRHRRPSFCTRNTGGEVGSLNNHHHHFEKKKKKKKCKGACNELFLRPLTQNSIICPDLQLITYLEIHVRTVRILEMLFQVVILLLLLNIHVRSVRLLEILFQVMILLLLLRNTC